MLKKNMLVVGLIIIVGAAVWYLVRWTTSSPSPFSSPTPAPTQESVPKETAEGTIKARKGGRFSIVLGSNHSTGYEWEFDYDSSNVELVDKEFWRPPRPTGFVGAGEIGTYIFQALKTGESQITASYLRPWEEKPPLKTRVYQINIEKVDAPL